MILCKLRELKSKNRSVVKPRPCRETLRLPKQWEEEEGGGGLSHMCSVPFYLMIYAAAAHPSHSSDLLPRCCIPHSGSHGGPCQKTIVT